MPKTISGFELVKFLNKKGFEVYSRKGSHVKLISIQRNTKTIVPLHEEISKGTLNSILRQAKLTREEINELFD
ncbi:MAG: type II toxin-antitoxin system HicA family toxin [Candidatus ainarchaeum sp.]|jgi:predicted RNA binding protein YcfA (HicA-like mRNA interferase family)|nr:type II toxin-antitoxin system HicA family toxin [Candidatus ainarchaeum sp.]MDD4128624.1 type II toxin-antitoxin system HicA family toxin [Candidatus ainarchaeum sp.]MDD4467898.1 type II toxin-antitoxin system HicA family toxin [Candidatus ainarchaeum sp.]HPM86210.1 type II toxin-antitoxin system HicA family toxin [archaeon]